MLPYVCPLNLCLPRFAIIEVVTRRSCAAGSTVGGQELGTYLASNSVTFLLVVLFLGLVFRETKGKPPFGSPQNKTHPCVSLFWSVVLIC